MKNDVLGVSNDDLLKKACACALVTVLAGSACVPAVAHATENADDSNADKDKKSTASGVSKAANTAQYTKDENVYGVLGAEGKPESLYVVNQFNVTSAGTIDDFGSYDAVQNLTDTTPIASVSGEQMFEAEEGVYYYEGTIENGTLPWHVSIEYTLDGKKVSPDTLAGADGRVGVHIATSKNDAVDPVFYDNYMLQVSFTVPTASCTNIDTDDAGIIADAGANRQITYTVMPGKDGDLIFEADATSFEMSAVQIAGAPFSMSMDDFDTAEMADGMQELADGVSSINDGAQQLADGTTELASGTGEFASGASQLAGGVGEVASGAQGLASGASDLSSGVLSLSDGLGLLSGSAAGLVSVSGGIASDFSSLTASSASVSDGAATVADDASNLAAALAAVDTSNMDSADAQAIADLVAQAQDLSTNASNVSQGAASYTAGVDNLASGYAGLDSDIRSLAEGVAQTATGADSLVQGTSQLSTGAGQLAGGTSELASGTQSLASGASELASGTNELASGTSQLADGTTEFASSTSDLPTKMQEEIDAALASYQGDFAPVSFVSADNENVELVQFVITTKAIEEPDEDVPVEEEEAPGFVERVKNLFTGSKEE